MIKKAMFYVKKTIYIVFTICYNYFTVKFKSLLTDTDSSIIYMCFNLKGWENNMVRNIIINEVHTATLSCEPMIERVANGELLCVCQHGGVDEPSIENRVYVFHSKDEGKTWDTDEMSSIYPEDGQAVYCTEMSVDGNEITAYLTVHSGSFFDWKCVMMKSFDNGYTWENYGHPPYFPEHTFIRARLNTSDGRILIPYQYYKITREDHVRVFNGKEALDKENTYCESGVIESTDGGKNYEKHIACRMPVNKEWIWSEPTIAEHTDGTISMLMRVDGSGWLYRCDSKDGGKTWGEYYRTNIPNPTNKPRLFNLPEGKIALIHTPNNEGMDGNVWGVKRSPLELWISDNNMKSWSEKIRLTDFPGDYSYTDGFYENGHIRFVIEHNRHTVLYFDVEL